MPKRKRGGRNTTLQTAPVLPRQLVLGLGEVEAMMARKQWDAARERLLDLDRRYPRQSDVIGMQVNLAHEQGDMASYLQAIEQYSSLAPNDPEVALAVAGANLANVRPALALQAFRSFLERWPDHERAADARAEIERLQPVLNEMLDEIGLAEESGPELAMQHERIQTLLAQNQWQQAIRVAEQALKQKPDFVPVLNNLSSAYFAIARADQAIETARRVLALDPQNYHALSNLTRFLCLSGRITEAQATARQLQAIELPLLDAATKQSEAFSFLGDDQAVLAAAQRWEQAKNWSNDPSGALLLHFAAVAALRQGDTKAAQRRWRQALKLAPWLEIAQENLDDLEKPQGERHGSWPFQFIQWVPRMLAEELAKHVTKASTRNNDHAVANATRRFVQQHPELAALTPLLLDHGDPVGREFALRLAMVLETPEMLAALRDFAYGQRGPDEMRHRAAIAAQQGGAIPTGQVRLWVRGAWQDLLLIGFEVSDDPQVHDIKPQALKLQNEAIVALRAGDAERAESLLKQALAIQSNEPGLYNNLASAYSMQGRGQDARALIEQTHARFPDYFFATLNLVMLHINDDQLDAAQSLLDSLFTRKRLHTTEFSGLMNAQLALLAALDKLDTAEGWLNMWAQAEPDNPRLASWRTRIASGKKQKKK